jgi:hypothetical protein
MTSRTRISFQWGTDVYPYIDQWASTSGFNMQAAQSNGVRLYQKGHGIMVAPMMLSVTQSGPQVEMEAWVRCNMFVRLMSLFMLPAEMGVESGGFRGVLPRKIARDAINELMRQLQLNPIP